MSIYKNLFDNISPEKPDNEFVAEILAVKKPDIKINPKKLTAAGIAAATAAAITVTGFASSQSFGEILHSWFNGKADIISSNISEISVNNASDNFEALDFEVMGAVNDEDLAVIFIDVTRTDGSCFDLEKYIVPDKNSGEPYRYHDGKEAEDTPDIRFSAHADACYSVEPVTRYKNGEPYEATISECEEILGIKQYIVDDGKPSDNKLTMAVCINKSEIENEFDYITLSLFTLKTERKTLSLVNGKNFAESYVTETLSGNWSADISLDFAECEKLAASPYETVSLEFYNNAQTIEALRHEQLDFTLTNLSVSPVSVCLNLEAPLHDEVMYQFISDIGEVVLKDGTAVKFGEDISSPFFINEDGGALSPEIADIAPYYNRGDKWIIKNTFMLERPIDISDVNYVRIGNKTFNF